MSFLDKLAAAVAPAASDEDRMKARQKAEQIGSSEEWLGMIVQQHKEIEALIDEAINAPDANARMKALRDFEVVLNGHSVAEEAVVYPDIAEESSKAHAAMAYEEHSVTKIQVAMMEKLDPMSQDWREKGEHIRGALQQHMYQEEDSWYPQLADKLSSGEKTRMTQRFTEEYERYVGTGSAALVGSSRASTQALY